MIHVVISFFLLAPFLLSQKLFKNEPEVRVRIIHTMDLLEVEINGVWEIQSDSSSPSITINDGDQLNFSLNDSLALVTINNDEFISGISSLALKRKSKTGTVLIKNVPYGIGWWWAGVEDRVYEGEMYIFIGANNNFEWVVKLPLEQYLKGVVPYEIGGTSPFEALKAQAIAARSEAIIALTSKLYSGPNHDLTSDVECQVFSGNKKRTGNSDNAVQETSSIILSENGAPINAYYASNCGGHSEYIKNVWPSRPEKESYKNTGMDNYEETHLNLEDEDSVKAWILSKPNVFCNPDLDIDLPDYSKKNFRWTKTFGISEMSQMLADSKEHGEFINLKVLNRGVSGRIYLADFIFEKDTIRIKGELAIRQMWKPALRSACFYTEKSDDEFTLKGAGWGHGVGMCQSGAVSMALQGIDYKKILAHYYKQAQIISVY